MDRKPTGKTIAIEGNGSRPSHRGDGYKESDVMYTLNTTEVHAVAYAFDRAAYNQGKNALWDFTVEPEICPPPGSKRSGRCISTRKRKPVPYQKITGTIDVCIRKGTSNQLVSQDMFIVEEFID